MVEHTGSSSKSNSKAKGKGKKKNDKKSKGKAEYLAPKARIRVNPHQANMVNDNVNMIAMVSDVIAMISEVNLVERLTMDRSCTWATLQLLISRAKEMSNWTERRGGCAHRVEDRQTREASRTCCVGAGINITGYGGIRKSLANMIVAELSQYISIGFFIEGITGTDNQEKDEKQSQNDKTGLGMEKTVKDKAKSKPESQSSQKVNRKVNWSKSKKYKFRD
ncbi:hypothetical protein Tco_0861077 [Tanacetum coccineum]|uniref:Uncharacterized protein n=1 Tax=Tanacetum coccineum TaxID=301880 RepID=A0ABQ5BGR4_9ASTR